MHYHKCKGFSKKYFEEIYNPSFMINFVEIRFNKYELYTAIYRQLYQ